MASTASTEAALETDDLLDVTMPLPQASLGMFSLTLMSLLEEQSESNKQGGIFTKNR